MSQHNAGDRLARRPARTRSRPALGDTPIAVGAARSNGWSESALRHAVSARDVESVRFGVVAAPEPTDPQTHPRQQRNRQMLRIARASVVTCPRAVVSHASAATALRIPLLGAPRACVTVTAGTPLRRLADVHLHRAHLPSDSIMDFEGFRQTTATRTVLDLTREFGVPAGLVAADHALHEGLTTPAQLRATLDRCGRWPGARVAARVVDLADGRTESPLESLSRLQMIDRRLAAPRPQAEIFDLDGAFLGRGDFYWDDFGVVGECDGEAKYEEDPGEAVRKERARQQVFERAGLIVVRWGWANLRSFVLVTQQLRTEFARGARPGDPTRRWLVAPESGGPTLHLPESLIPRNRPR